MDMTDREVMQMALLTLEGWANYDKWVYPMTALGQAKRNTTEAIAALRARLAEPVCDCKVEDMPFGRCCKAQPSRRPLTDDEVESLFCLIADTPSAHWLRQAAIEIVRKTEAAHGIT